MKSLLFVNFFDLSKKKIKIALALSRCYVAVVLIHLTSTTKLEKVI